MVCLRKNTNGFICVETFKGDIIPPSVRSVRGEELAVLKSASSEITCGRVRLDV